MATNHASYGVIPYRATPDGFMFLLVCHHAGHWGFPKGHALPGESAQVAAFRELSEETGITVSSPSWAETFVETYEFMRDRKLVHKSVTYFLLHTCSAVVHIQQEELQDYRWAAFDEALELISYAESRRILNAAVAFLKSKEKDRE